MRMVRQSDIRVDEVFLGTVYVVREGGRTPLFGYVLTRDDSNELVSVDFGYTCPTDAENACMADILQVLYRVHRAEV
jgi:hypothetical protein